MRIHLPVRPAILARHTYETPAEGRQGKIRLDFNENTSGCSAAVRIALARLSAVKISTYPEYEMASHSLARYFGVCPEELLVANGGDDALRAVFDTFADPRREVVIFEPTFPMYRYYAEITGARIRALRYGPNMEFPAAEALASLRRKPRLLFVTNPNNPTGTLVPKRILARLLRKATHTAVVVDEAYAEFSTESIVPWIRRYPHLFIVRTFSKAAGLAGLRLGAVLANRESLAFVRRAMPPFPVNCAALIAGVAAVNDRKTLARYVRGTVRRRTWFARQLHLAGVRVFPSAGNFLLADFGNLGPLFFRKLAEHGILIREYKILGPGFARITVGTQSELEKLLYLLRRTP